MTGLTFIIVLALVFDYLNGFHDAANSIATVVSTRVLSPAAAVAPEEQALPAETSMPARSSAISSVSVVPMVRVAISSPARSASVIASAEPPSALIEAASSCDRLTP